MTAVLIARETGAGQRILHLYTDTPDTTTRTVRDACATWTVGPTTVTSTPDPTWHAIGHLPWR